MKRILVICIFVLGIVHAQGVDKLIQYEISFPDSILKDVDGNFMYRYLPHKYKIFADSLYKKASAEKNLQYWRTPQGILSINSPFIFPVVSVDTIMAPHDYPPYEIYTLVQYSQLLLNDIVGVKYYERWESAEWSVKGDNYKKTLIAWSFKVIQYSEVGQNMGNRELQYLFLTDTKHLPYLKQKLNK